METLNTAARAAGFAMAASDEPYEEVKAAVETADGLPTQALMLTPATVRHQTVADWYRTMLGFFGRAPASPA